MHYACIVTNATGKVLVSSRKKCGVDHNPMWKNHGDRRGAAELLPRVENNKSEEVLASLSFERARERIVV